MALKVIFGFQGLDDVHAVLDEFWKNFRFHDDILGEALDEVETPVPSEIRLFTEELIVGLADHLPEVDAVIREKAKNWSLDRMARVDLAIMRLATYEILYCPQTPANVILNEAIEIAKRFGTKESPSFINGILDQVARTCRKEKQ